MCVYIDHERQSSSSSPHKTTNQAPPQPPTAAAAAAAQSSSRASPSKTDQPDSKKAALLENARIPLNREEIAKLLLYTAKAYQLKRINGAQKNRIKDLICQRAGYVRIVLQQTDLNVLFEALSIIGGDE